MVHGAWALAAALPMLVRVEAESAPTPSVVSDRVAGGSRGILPILKTVEAMAHELSFDPGVRVKVSSEVPEGAGLGSSAATLVAVVSAVSRLRGFKLTPQEVSRFAMVGEREVHGRPSGVDAEICARGGVLLFRPGSPPREVPLDGTRSLMVAFSGSRRSTRVQVENVAKVRKKSMGAFDLLVAEASERSLEAADTLSKGDLRGLGRLLSASQLALSRIGVSTRSLEGLIAAALSLGAYGAKLTGGGGGGSIIAVAARGKEKSIVSGLRGRGYEAFVAEVPVKGARSWLER